jgi:RluA family pseudouridine synthase
VVGPGDGHTVGEVLVRAGLDPGAVADGRVFVGRRRASRGDEAVREGDVLDVALPLASDGAGPGGDAPVQILAQDADLVAVDKPAGIPTIPDHAGSAHSLIARTAAALGVAAAALHATSRLDREVSGAVVFATTHAAAERLRLAREHGLYARRYVAIAARAPEPPSATWDAPIGRHARNPRLRATRGRDPAVALTRYAVVALAPGGAALLALAPVTGRTHQIRVHAAAAGAPLIGDRAYGGPVRLVVPSGKVIEPARIALHALQVRVPRSVTASAAGPAAEPLTVTAPVPEALRALWSALGGTPEAWNLAASCALASS